MFDALLVPAVEGATAAASAVTAYWIVRHHFRTSVPPNRALVLFGRHSSRASVTGRASGSGVDIQPPRIIVGGATFVAPWSKGVGQLSLDPVTFEVTVRSVQALAGTHACGWEVVLKIQAKIPAEPGFLLRAAENLLGKSPDEIEALLRHTVEGAVPAVLARLRPDEGEPEWERLAAEIQASVASDVAAWGYVIRILSIAELHRLVPSDPPPAAAVATVPTRAGEAGGRTNLASVLHDLNARVSRTERRLEAVDRRSGIREWERVPSSPPERWPSVFDRPLGWEADPSGNDPASVRYDSAEAAPRSGTGGPDPDSPTRGDRNRARASVE